MHWSEERLLLHADQNNVSLSATSPKDLKDGYRTRLWKDYMKGKAEEAAAIVRAKKEQARALYEKGATTKKICQACKIPLKKLITWIHNRKTGDEWFRPGEETLPTLPMHAPVALPVAPKPEEIASVSLVTDESEDQLAAPVKELRREMRLMNLRGKEWAEVSYADKKDALEMQVVGLAIRIVERLKRMDDDELIDKEVVKTIAAMQQIKVNATPKVEVSQKPAGLLHISVMNGDAGLPPRARAREIEQAG